MSKCSSENLSVPNLRKAGTRQHHYIEAFKCIHYIEAFKCIHYIEAFKCIPCLHFVGFFSQHFSIFYDHRNSGPDRIIRASRHYEKAGQILTRRAVATAKQFINGTPCDPPAIGQTVTAMAPARVDLAGGWSDTPPIAYEFGGAVVTLSLKLNNEVCTYARG